MYKFMVRASYLHITCSLRLLCRVLALIFFHFAEIRESEDGRKVLEKYLKSADLQIDRMAID